MATGPRARRNSPVPPAALLILVVLLAGCAPQATERAPATTPAALSATPGPTSPRPASGTGVTPVATVGPGAGTATAPPGTEGQRLLAELRRGGYVIFFRHAATDFSQADTDRQNLENCRTQRNLSPQGRADAERIGDAFRLLRIPVGQILASPYCRARDTAQLAFARHEITRDLLALPSARDEAERQALIDAFARLLAAPPPVAGTNTVLVGHDFSIQAVADLTIAEGEAAIFEPRGAEGFRLVGRVPHYGWPALEYAASGTRPHTRGVAAEARQGR